MDEWFDLRCGAPATMVATDGEREGFVCGEDAARAVLAGWSVYDLADAASMRMSCRAVES